MKKNNPIYLKFIKCAAICICVVCFVSCGGGDAAQKEFDNMLERVVKDDQVTMKEYERLTVLLDKAKEKGVTLAQDVSTGEELVIYIRKKYPKIVFEEGIEKIAIAVTGMNIFLENSASMKGYFPNGGNIDFTNPIMTLFNILKVPVKTAYIGEKLMYVDNETFQSQLANGKVANGASSPLQDVMQNIIDSTDVSTVSCLITDGIMSGSNQEIKSNKQFNYNNRPVLQQRIRKAFENAKNKGLSVLVYRLESPFNGVYYNYMNDAIKLESPARPYYLFFIGNKEILAEVQVKLKNEKAFNPTDVLAIGASTETVSKYKLKAMKGQDYVADNASVTYNSMPAKDALIGVRVDLSSLPAYLKTAAKLKEISSLTTTSGEKEIDYSNFIESIEVIDEKTEIYQYNIEIEHALLQKLPLDIRIRVQNAPDSWYKERSLDRDEQVTIDEKGTFALDYFIEGIINGAESGASSNLMDIKFSIKKK